MPWEIAHAVRGRVRVRYAPGWLHARRATIEARLRRLPGVRRVDARPLTGSLSIDYDARRVTHAGLVATLTEIAGEPASEGNGTGALIAGAGTGTPWSVMLQLAGATSVLAATALPVGAPVKAALVLGAGLPSLLRAARALAGTRRVNGDVLEALTLVLLAVRGQQAAAGLLLWSRAAGDFVLSRSTGRARRSLRELVAPETQTAWRLDGDERSAVAVRSLKPGDLIVVTGPQPLVVDGTVVRGEAYVDQQTMTGEGLPVERREGDPVFAATVVEDGEIVVRVDRTGEDTAIGRIIREIDAATEQKSEIQDFAERLADSQASRTLVLAALGAAFSGSLSAGIAILVADYGMAARVGIPTALVSAMTTASRAGILTKGTRVLERLARVDTLVFDKTGTLTSGTPAVSRLVTYDRARDDDDLVRLTAAAERGYRHPVARAIAALAEERRLHVPRRMPGVPAGGLGVDARVDDARVLVGSRRFMESHHIDLTAAARDEAAAHTVGGSPTFVAVDGRLTGLIVLRDELRADAPALVAALRARGMREIIMVTGDHPEPTRVIAASLGVREFYSDMMPADKAALVRRLKRRGRVVAMVGDGVNDALALDVADVGIAVRGGPAVVAEAADIVLVRAGLDGVVQAIDVARAGLGSVRRTVRVAARANLAVVGLASVGLAQPVASILLSRGVAVAAATGIGAPGRWQPPRRALSVSTR